MITIDTILAELSSKRETLSKEIAERNDEEIKVISQNGCWDFVSFMMQLSRTLRINDCPFNISHKSPSFLSSVFNTLGIVELPQLTSENCGLSLNGIAESIFTDSPSVEIYTNDIGEEVIGKILNEYHGHFNVKVLCNRKAGRINRMLERINTSRHQTLDIKSVSLDDKKAFEVINGIDWFGVTDKYIDTWQIEAVRRICPQTIRQLCASLYLSFHRLLFVKAPDTLLDQELLLFLGQALEVYTLAYLKCNYNEEFWQGIR